MPMLDFKGKQFVYAHHLSVPFRTLEIDAKKSLPPLAQDADGVEPVPPATDAGLEGRLPRRPKRSKPDLDDNLIIHGDNLHALKALLPTYAGKVDCIIIDPPYNTGNEGWCYNDNVRSPLMQEWIKDAANPVDNEDLERHDKWCCMMWPRMKLLHELLSETGSLFVFIDDNEVHALRQILDEVFGRENFVDTVIWQKNYSPKSTARHFSSDHDYILVYAKHADAWSPDPLERTAEQDAAYKNPDDDPRGPWKTSDLSARNPYSKGLYPITCPSGREIKGPPTGNYWRYAEEKFKELDADNRIWWGKDGNAIPQIKRFLSEVKEGRVPQTLWQYSDVGHTQEAKKEIVEILDFDDSASVFITPKPVRVIERILQLATEPDSIILDSFAGSGTTAHAVLKQNQKDDGNRRFILVECEDYADTLTAERVRRVINGYSFEGTQREELYRRKLNFTALKKAEEILGSIEGIENLEGHRFDKISKTLKNDELIVTGEKKVTEKTEGLGGSFTYCTLGEEINLQTLLSGEKLPAYDALAKYVFYTATGQTLSTVGGTGSTPSAPPSGRRGKQVGVEADPPGPGNCWFIGETTLYRVHLIYKPEKKWLRSNASALTQELVDAIAKQADPTKKTLVFASTKFMGQKDLTRQHIEFCQLPYAIYRVLGD